MKRTGLTMAELSGDPIQFIDAPGDDAVYVLRRRDGEATGAAILCYALVYSSYMPTLEGAREWVNGDIERQFLNRRETAE